jgi:large subunit ribosomal protein L19
MNTKPLINKIEQEEIQKANKSHAKFKVGDQVCVTVMVREGEKERPQKFTGICIGRRGTGINEHFTVRRISYGEGVERVFPVHSPRIARIEVETPGRARRAALNYLRGRKGKQAMAVREEK